MRHSPAPSEFDSQEAEKPSSSMVLQPERRMGDSAPVGGRVMLREAF